MSAVISALRREGTNKKFIQTITNSFKELGKVFQQEQKAQEQRDLAKALTSWKQFSLSNPKTPYRHKDEYLKKISDLARALEKIDDQVVISSMILAAFALIKSEMPDPLKNKKLKPESIEFAVQEISARLFKEYLFYHLAPRDYDIVCEKESGPYVYREYHSLTRHRHYVHHAKCYLEGNKIHKQYLGSILLYGFEEGYNDPGL